MKKVFKQYLRGFELVTLDTQPMKCRVHFTKEFEADTLRELHKKIKEFKNSLKNEFTITKQVKYTKQNENIEILNHKGISELLNAENLFYYI